MAMLNVLLSYVPYRMPAGHARLPIQVPKLIIYAWNSDVNVDICLFIAVRVDVFVAVAPGGSTTSDFVRSFLSEAVLAKDNL